MIPKIISVITKLTLIVLFLALFSWIIAKNFVFSGNLDIKYDFWEESPFISMLYPRGRVDQEYKTDFNGDIYQNILMDPVYFDVTLPRSFQKAKVTVKYKNPNENLLEMGVSAGKEEDPFNMRPIENKLLDTMIQNNVWYKLEEDGAVLLQKNLKFFSIKDFLKQFPEYYKVGAYNYDINFKYLDPNYTKSDKVLEINKSLRGPHQFYTYVKDQDLQINFNLQDVNRVEGEDDINLKVYYYDREVFSKNIKGDFIKDDSANMSEPFDYELFLSKPPEGLYKIIFESSDDIFIRQIKTPLKYITFIDYIYLGDNVGYLNENDASRYEPTELYTNAEKLSAVTSHQEGFQEIKFGQKSIAVDQKHAIFSANNPYSERQKEIETVNIKNNDIKLIGKGLFAFTKESFFNPEIKKLTGDPNMPLDIFGIEYVIANYSQPKSENDWKIGAAEFDLKGLNDGDNSFRFVFSFPYSAREETLISISEISMQLETNPIGINDFIKKSFLQFLKLFKI